MSQEKWDDLYDRLTSRKLLLALLSIGFATWSYYNGHLTSDQFQNAIMIAVGTYTAAEGASDALAAFTSGKSPPPTENSVDETMPKSAIVIDDTTYDALADEIVQRIEKKLREAA